MIDGLHAAPELQSRQVQYIIARLAFRQFIIENALDTIFRLGMPEGKEARENARLTLQMSLTAAEDPGRVIAFAAEHSAELLPASMR